LTPARVYRPEGGDPYFRLCRGDANWTRRGSNGNQVQYAAWVPAHRNQKQLLRRIGALARGPLTKHHGTHVTARVVLYQYERNGKPQFQVWRATHLAKTQAEIEQDLHDTSRPDPERSGKLTLKRDVAPRVVRGWLSATGYSI